MGLGYLFKAVKATVTAKTPEKNAIMLELNKALTDIEPIMKDKNKSRTEKRETLNEMVNNFTTETFSDSFAIDTVIAMINVREDVSKEYANTEAQVKGILAWLPRMVEYRGKLEEYVNKYRKQYGLEL